MGTPVPPEWPELKDDKFYCCTIDWYHTWGETLGCNANYVGRKHCCRQGDFIKAWYAAGKECVDAMYFCYQYSPGAHRVICILGPFDTMEDCVDFCPEP